MYLFSQLAKSIERAYQNKAQLDYQITEIQQQKYQLDLQIQTFERALGYLDPEFDLRTIQKKFKVRQNKVIPFNQNVRYLLSLVLNQAEGWLKLTEITCRVIKLDGKYEPTTRERLLTVGNALRRLYKQGIIERREVALHAKAKKRGLFQRSEWRIKPLFVFVIDGAKVVEWH